MAFGTMCLQAATEGLARVCMRPWGRGSAGPVLMGSRAVMVPSPRLGATALSQQREMDEVPWHR